MIRIMEDNLKLIFLNKGQHCKEAVSEEDAFLKCVPHGMSKNHHVNYLDIFQSLQIQTWHPKWESQWEISNPTYGEESSPAITFMSNYFIWLFSPASPACTEYGDPLFNKDRFMVIASYVQTQLNHSHLYVSPTCTLDTRPTCQKQDSNSKVKGVDNW